ncbi:hypothetical protein GWI33_006174 [Rhynchophorus ferrugineus]|uniref:Uncharacterized protein n=1 Tax=Rhynchophorus ferrugineus TaxID=354439 RepID=A0A834J2H6_RHYFE|nr:hypothetical protein GWI33_006174 [Rhynchophorus ferrugineus]
MQIMVIISAPSDTERRSHVTGAEAATAYVTSVHVCESRFQRKQRGFPVLNRPALALPVPEAQLTECSFLLTLNDSVMSRPALFGIGPGRPRGCLRVNEGLNF